MNENEYAWDDDWPSVEPTEILPRLWMGGTSEDRYIGGDVPPDHYDFAYEYDFIVTLYADAMPAPWGTVEFRLGFPDGELSGYDAARCQEMAHLAWQHWKQGRTVLVRCQQGVNRSGLVTAMILMFDGMGAEEAVALLRERRGPLVLNNPSCVDFLSAST